MLARLLLPTVLILGLAGCAAQDDALTLVETKSPVQLLRNEAWYRLPEFIVKEDSETTDTSIACDDDPDGLMRSWTSSTIALVNNSFAPRTRGVAEDLVASFEEQGWAAERTDGDSSFVSVLTRTTSVAVIEIEATDKTKEHRASIRITTSGPCVQTDGPESDEVTSLEGE